MSKKIAGYLICPTSLLIGYAVRDQFMRHLPFKLIHHAMRGEWMKKFFDEKS